MQLKGKKIVILGDSITEGVGTSAKEKSFPYVLQAISGAIVKPFGVSGTRYAAQRDNSLLPDFSEYFYQRSLRMDTDADVVLVFGGTNDFGHGDAPFGEFSDRDENTFMGACHQLYSSLIERYPDKLIAIMTPLHRTSEDVHIKEIKDLPTRPLKDYVEAERQIAEYYSLPIIDLYAESGMQPAIEVIKERYMPDGLHPSDEGAERLARFVYAKLLCM